MLQCEVIFTIRSAYVKYYTHTNGFFKLSINSFSVHNTSPQNSLTICFNDECHTIMDIDYYHSTSHSSY